MYTSIVKGGIVEINILHVYSEWIDLVKSLCVCRLILKLHIAKKLARYGTCQ